tara:strand:+ start:1397 stop:1903 length:507 start_codon:yes stop_codon:yes gene_type:complete
MLSFKKLKFIVGSFLIFLFACGYQPLINNDFKKSPIFNSGRFIIFSPKSDIDFHIKEKLLSDFGFAKNPKYKIELKNSLRKKKSIFTENNEITRYNLILKSTLFIIEIKTNEVIFSKKIDTETAFSASTSMTGFKAEVAQNNAKKRLAYDIAEKVRMEILIFGKDFLN